MNASTFRSTRRALLKTTGVALALPLATISRGAWSAAAFPSAPISLIVPWPPGGPNDVIVRSLATAASSKLGQPFVIINKPGASGSMGAVALQNAKPDGYTISQMSVSVLRLPQLQTVSYDPLKDLSYIVGVATASTGILVRADAPWTTFPEMLAYAKAHPGAVAYATTGAGTTLHLAMEQVSKMTGAEFLHVPYKGTAETTLALLGGDTALQLESIGVATVRSGKARVLATFNADRSPVLPAVATLKELGIDVVANSPLGFVGPKGMDPEIVKILQDAFKAAMDDPQYRAVALENAQDAWYRSGAEYQQWAVQTTASEGRLIKSLGLGKS